MSTFFYNLGRKTGQAMRRPKWYYKSFFGDSKEAVRAENAYGRELAEQMQSQFRPLRDADSVAVIENIARELCQRVKNPERRFNFLPVESGDVNAFALPGGYVFITGGIIDLYRRNPDRLAMIMAHEMIHVLSRHPVKRILTSKSLAVLAKMIKVGNSVGQLAKNTLGSLIESSYSQENEYYADRYGLQLMIRCGYDGAQGIEALRSLQGQNKNDDRFNYLSTHPPISERVRRLQRELERLQ